MSSRIYPDMARITGRWRFKKDATGKVRMQKAPRNLSVSDKIRQRTSKKVRVSRRLPG